MGGQVVPLVMSSINSAEFLKGVVGMEDGTEGRLCLKVCSDLVYWIGVTE